MVCNCHIDFLFLLTFKYKEKCITCQQVSTVLKQIMKDFYPLPPFVRRRWRNQGGFLDGDGSRKQREREARKRIQSAWSASLLLFLKQVSYCLIHEVYQHDRKILDWTPSDAFHPFSPSIYSMQGPGVGTFGDMNMNSIMILPSRSLEILGRVVV